MPLKTCRKGLHQYDATAAPRVGKYPACPECLRTSRARYLNGDKGRKAVARYRESEKGRATWRNQARRSLQKQARRRAGRQQAAGLLPGMKFCRAGLHQYDPATATGCAQCRRVAKLRYRGSAAGRAAEARYERSDKGRARKARYRRGRKKRAGASGAN